MSEIKTEFNGIKPEADLLPPAPSDVPALPTVAEWKSVRDFGAIGDGKADDTAAFKSAIAQHDIIFVPAGRYRLTDTLQLRPNTNLIGLHPRSTMLDIRPGTPGFGDVKTPKSLVQTAPNGHNYFASIGLSLTDNPSAVGLRWMAGENSLLDDFWISWSEGGPKASSQFAGLWISGGGTFKNIWMANEAAPGGVIISDTSTRGRAYLWSIEHHTEYEVRMRNVRNWEFYALQTENSPPQLQAVPVDMEQCRNLLFANLYLYRTSSHKEAAEYGVLAKNSSDFLIRGVHSYSLSPYPAKNTLWLSDKAALTEREAAIINVAEAAH